MEIKDLIPWKRDRKTMPDDSAPMDPVASLKRDVSRLFNDFFQRMKSSDFEWPGAMGQAFTPRVDVAEEKDVVTVVADLPGMDEKSVEILLSGSLLTLKGEKKQESEERGRDFYRLERSFGSFRRVVPLPCEVEPDHMQASFKKGVLRVTLPKTRHAKEGGHRVEVKAG